MGQYLNGEKIGTCENMYYMRLSQAQKQASHGGRDDDGITFESMLKDNETRFRFPWPDEDGREKAGLLYSNVTDFERGFTIPVPPEIEVNHGEICVSNCHKGGGHNVNMFLPCPHSKEFQDMGIKTSTDGAGQQYITIMYKAMRLKIDHETEKEIPNEYEETTLYACSRCGQLQRTSRHELEIIKAYATEHFTRQYKLVSERDLQNEELVAKNKKALDDVLAIIERI